MKFVLSLAVAAALAVASAAFAEVTAAPATDQAAPKADEAKSDAGKPAYNPDEVVCKTSQVTGSRLGGHRVCRTRAEWDQKTQEDHRMINNMQSQILKGPGG